MNNPTVTVIIPMYNESKIICDTAEALSNYMGKNFDSYEIIFSDDGSKDGCGELVKNMGLPCVRVEGYAQNRGKGGAVRHAMLCSKGNIVMFTDADLAYGLDVIKKACESLLNAPDTDVLIGSRNLSKDGYEGYTFMRKVASKAYIKVLGMMGSFKLSDSQCGCKAFRGDMAREIFSRCKVNGFAFDFEVILWAQQLGAKIAEMPIKIINHRASTVNVWRDSFKMLRDVRRIRKDVRAVCKQEQLKNRQEGN